MKCIPCPCDATMDRIKTDTRTPVIYYVTVCFRHSNLEIKIKYTDIQFYPICFIEKGRILSSCPSRFRFGTSPCCLMVVQLPSWGKNKCRALQSLKQFRDADQSTGRSTDSAFLRPTWGPTGADRTRVGPRWAPWTLLSGSSGRWRPFCLGLHVSTF